MRSEDIERKIRSFSEHHGLGKVYHSFEFTDLLKENYRPEVLSAQLPNEVRMTISSMPRTVLLFLIVLTCILLLTSKGIEGMAGRGMDTLYLLPAFGLVIAFLGIDFISRQRRKKKLRILMNEDELHFNKDVFKWSSIKTICIKKDLNRNRRVTGSWLIVVLKNDDLYYYPVTLRMITRKIKNGLSLAEIMILYKNHSASEKSTVLNSFGPQAH
jgi:hypothetical protein